MSDNKPAEPSNLDAVRRFYETRHVSADFESVQSLLNPGTLYAVQSRERALVRALRSTSTRSLSDLCVLEVGSGAGLSLLSLLHYGFEPSNLFGLDIVHRAVKRARDLNPSVRWTCGDGERLPFAEERFDVVMQWTMFSQLLDRNLRQRVASEMMRVLRPDGFLIWYDWYVGNPGKPDQRRVGKRELRRLFPGTDMQLKRIMLPPPVARRVASLSITLCDVLEAIPLFCSAYVGIITKQRSSLSTHATSRS